MKGAPASLASRREISVLPMPVGPIIRIFLGSTSSRSSSSSCCRRQRLRSAMATARLASRWPMMWRSSSETISRGENEVMWLRLRLQTFDDDFVVGVNANGRGNRHCFARNRFGVELRVEEGTGRGKRKVSAGADAHDVVVRFEHVTFAG